MNVLRLDFARRRATDSRIGLSVLGAGAMLLALAATYLHAQRVRADALAPQERGVEQALQERRAIDAMAQAAPLNAEASEAARLQQLSVQPGIVAIESNWRPDIAVLHVDLATQQRRIRLEVEARTVNDLLSFVDALEQSPRIEKASLNSHGVREEDPNRPVIASIDAVWREVPLVGASAAEVRHE